MNLTVFAGILLAVTLATARRASLGEKTMQAAGKADEPGEAARLASLVEKIMRAADEAEKPDEAKRQSAEQGAIRLVDGNTPYEGRIEIFHAGQWGTICGYGAGAMKNAKVACKQLGYGEAKYWVRAGGDYQGLDTQPIMLDNVFCNGWEDKVSNCARSGWEETKYCRHSEDAFVKCKPPCKDWYETRDECDECCVGTCYIQRANGYYECWD